MKKYFDFEKPIEDIDKKIDILKKDNVKIDHQLITKHNQEKKLLLKKIYSSLNSWQKIQVARHSDRPHTLDYIKNVFTKFITLSGDKKFSDDQAIIGGLAKINDSSVIVIGNEKGSSMESRIKHNFGMARPEGYRKVQRLLTLAEKLSLPVITFIDTAGAFPGKEAEERGQSESIASSIAKCLKAKTPIISIIIGEGGSGGAIALASSNKVLMLQNAIYSVISPEGCATILWRDPKKTLEASKAMKLSSKDLLNLEIIDEIIPEPIGGAHRDTDLILDNVRNSITKNLDLFINMDENEILTHRKNKFLSIGRNKGFSSQSNINDNLSMQVSLFEKYKIKLIKNKLIIGFFLLLLLFLVSIIFYNQL